jgi:hypothetical protein
LLWREEVLSTVTHAQHNDGSAADLKEDAVDLSPLAVEKLA